MEIKLEQIDLVKDRTGCTYLEAKSALEAADGSVVDAIIEVEKARNASHDRVDGESLKDSPVFHKIQQIVEKGNVSKIIISKDGRTIVKIPVTVGVLGTVLVPWGAVLGAVAAVGTQCNIDFLDDKGRLIDVDSKINDAYVKVTNAGTAVKKVLDGVSGTAKKVKDSAKKVTETKKTGLDDEESK